MKRYFRNEQTTDEDDGERSRQSMNTSQENVVSVSDYAFIPELRPEHHTSSETVPTIDFYTAQTSRSSFFTAHETDEATGPEESAESYQASNTNREVRDTPRYRYQTYRSNTERTNSSEEPVPLHTAARGGETKEHVPVWYQQTGSTSSDWLDGGAHYDRTHDPSNQTGAFAPDVAMENAIKQEKRRSGLRDPRPYSEQDVTAKNIVNVFRRNQNRNSSNASSERNQQTYDTENESRYTTNVVLQVCKIPQPQGSQQPQIKVFPLTREASIECPFTIDTQTQIFHANTSNKQTFPSSTHTHSSRENSKNTPHSPNRTNKTSGPKNTSSPHTNKCDSKSSAHQDQGNAVQKSSGKPLFIRIDESNVLTDCGCKPHNAVSKKRSKHSTSGSKEKKRMKPCKCKTENCNCKRVTCVMRDKSTKSQSKSQIAQVHRPTKKESCSNSCSKGKRGHSKGSREVEVSVTFIKSKCKSKSKCKELPKPSSANKHESTTRALKSPSKSHSSHKPESIMKASKSPSKSHSFHKPESTMKASKSHSSHKPESTMKASKSHSFHKPESTMKASKSRSKSQSFHKRESSTTTGSKSPSKSHSFHRNKSTTSASKSQTKANSPDRQDSPARTQSPYRQESPTRSHSSARQVSSNKSVTFPEGKESKLMSPSKKESAKGLLKKPSRHESPIKPSTKKNYESQFKQPTETPQRRESPMRLAQTRTQQYQSPVQPTTSGHQRCGSPTRLAQTTAPKSCESPIRLSTKGPQRYESPVTPAPTRTQQYESPVQPTTSGHQRCGSPTRPAQMVPQRYESPVRLRTSESQRQESPPTQQPLVKQCGSASRNTPSGRKSSKHLCSRRSCNKMVPTPRRGGPPSQRPSSSALHRENQNSLDYIPIWYQHAGSKSSDWLDGGAYYAHKRNPANQIGAFAPNVNVEEMVKMEKKKRKIKDVAPYSNEELKKLSRRKSRNTTGASTVSSRGGTSTDYTVYRLKDSHSVTWSYDMETEPTHQTRSTPVFNMALGVNGPFEYVEDIFPYSREPLAQTQPSIYAASSVSSGTATGAFDTLAYPALFNFRQKCKCGIPNCECSIKRCTSRDKLRKFGNKTNAKVNYNQPCKCAIGNCNCSFRTCTSRDGGRNLGGAGTSKQTCTCNIDDCKCMFKSCSSKARTRQESELGSDSRCINPSLMSACSRGRPSRTKRGSTASGYSRVFVRRPSGGGDYKEGCQCTTEDCHCLYHPCAARERKKRRARLKKRKQPTKTFKPKRRRTIDDEKCILCQASAIEKPYSWCMRTCCITWVWSDREFIRHRGRVLGPLPDYREKPLSLRESAMQRWWNRQYVFDEYEDEEIEIRSGKLK